MEDDIDDQRSSSGSKRSRGRPPRENSMSENSVLSVNQQAKARGIAINFDFDETNEILASQLPNRLNPMPNLGLDYLEQSMSQHKDLGSEIQILRDKASEMQLMTV